MFNGGFGFNRFGFGGFGFNRFGFGFNRFGFNRFGFGCWGCGFGFGGFGWGFGWGWGWPGWWGWWGPGWLWWDPFWYDPWWGWPGYAYYPYSHPNFDYNLYNTPPGYYSTSSPDNSSSDSSENSSANASQNAPGSQGSPNNNSLTGNVAASTPTVLLYLKDGTTYVASDYWLANNELHYVVNYGGEGVLQLDEIDLQRTVDENAKRGVRFTLKTAPNRWNPAPNSTGNGSTGAAQPNPGVERTPQDIPASTATPAPVPAPESQAQTTSRSNT